MFPVNLETTSGLQILLHSVISLPDATSCDNTFLIFHDWFIMRAKVNRMYSSVEDGNINSIMFVTAGAMQMLRVHQCVSKKVEYVFLLNFNQTCL